MQLESKLLIAVVVCAIFLSVSAGFINWLVSRSLKELSAWGGWVMASIFRLVAIITIGMGAMYFRSLHSGQDLDIKMPVFIATAILLGSMVFDVVLSTRRLKRANDALEDADE